MPHLLIAWICRFTFFFAIAAVVIAPITLASNYAFADAEKAFIGSIQIAVLAFLCEKLALERFARAIRPEMSPKKG
jgi:hypothetical protein